MKTPDDGESIRKKIDQLVEVKNFWDQFNGGSGGGNDDEDPFDEPDSLERYLSEIIYEAEKDRKLGQPIRKDMAERIAQVKAPKFARTIVNLLGPDAFEQIVGGYADGAGFSFDLEDGQAINGNEFECKFVNKE